MSLKVHIAKFWQLFSKSESMVPKMPCFPVIPHYVQHMPAPAPGRPKIQGLREEFCSLRNQHLESYHLRILKMCILKIYKYMYIFILSHFTYMCIDR